MAGSLNSIGYIAKVLAKTIKSWTRLCGAVSATDVLSEKVLYEGRVAVFGWEAFVLEADGRIPSKVALHLDLSAWLASLTARMRRLVVFLAVGNTVEEAACEFGPTRRSVEELQRQLRDSWARFQGQE